MILNETPIRTAKNYGINNIKLDDVEIPKNIGSFDGLNISGDIDKFKIDEKKNLNKLTYGNSEILSKQIIDNANKNIHILIDDDLPKELNLDFNLSDKNKNLVDDILIELKENANGNIIIRYLSEKEEKCYHNGQIRVMAQKGSKLNIILLNLLNNKTGNYVSIENILEENTSVKYTIVDFGGKNSITNYYSNLKGEKSSNEVNTIYLGTESQILDLNYIAEVYGKSSKINMNLKGAIKDNSKKHFKGTIDFKQGCKKSKGDETEYCTILSDTAKSISLPMLLCTEEDIEGNHGTASGKIDPKQLFYLMSRGLSLKEAQKLIVRGAFNEIIENTQNDVIKNQVIEEIENRL